MSEKKFTIKPLDWRIGFSGKSHKAHVAKSPTQNYIILDRVDGTIQLYKAGHHNFIKEFLESLDEAKEAAQVHHEEFMRLWLDEVSNGDQ